MKLKLEKDIKVSAQISGKSFVNSETGVLYQHTTDDEIYIYIRCSKDPKKELKIRLQNIEKNKKLISNS